MQSEMCWWKEEEAATADGIAVVSSWNV